MTQTRRPVGSATPSVRWEAHADFVVVGGGVAGLSAAQAAAARGLSVLILQKGSAAYAGDGAGPDAATGDTSTAYAQGGVAVARAGADSSAAHADDTCAAGGGLCDRAAVESIVGDGEQALRWLVGAGARFDRDSNGAYAVTREGGHRVRRILHSGGDATGAEVQRALDDACVPGEGRGIVRIRGAAVLRVCSDDHGVSGVLAHTTEGHGVVHAPTVLLATGGLGRLYASSTNPAAATADGIALALDAGATVRDLEFIQFHPTALYIPGSIGRSALISEAVRGEGAVLIDARGRPVTRGVHPMGDLAPRDVVARAIAMRLRESGDSHVLLDARGIRGFAGRFPTITASCAQSGIDPAVDPIPVSPAAHFSCGGVVSDVYGRTGVPGLLAAGEVACTGLHGANRLASNSLLEGLVVGARAGHLARERAAVGSEVRDASLRPADVAPRGRVQESMTAHASVIRSGGGIAAARNGIASASQQALVRSGAEAEDAAITLAASVVLLAAAERTETRGCHTRTDHPDPDPRWCRSIGVRLGEDGRPRIIGSGKEVAGRGASPAPAAVV